MSKHLPEESVEVFIDAARSYCSLIEAADALPRGQFVWQVGERLTRLYAAASALPETDPTGTEGPGDRIGDAEGFALAHRLKEKLGDLGRYRRVHDPYDANETGVEGSLSDDLADIYGDVKNGLTAVANGVPQADVVWAWRDSFGHHWGIHAAAALYAIHWITHTAGEEWISPDAP